MKDSRKEGKIALFHFFYLYTTQIIILSMCLFFICLSSTQEPRRTVLRQKNVGGALDLTCTPNFMPVLVIVMYL
jgi:hypothetical protein